VWDQYRIDAVRMTITAQNNAVGLVTNSTTALTALYTVIDYDNSTNLGSIATARQYSNCAVLEPGKSLIRTFQPRVAIGAYSGAFTSFANMTPPWIDCSSASVNHYGIKIFVPGVTAAQTQLQSWDINFEYYVSLKSNF
jgi:hypothetical protein